MKNLFDIKDNELDEILTQFNEYEYSSALALICMCVEEYCLAHNLDATEIFRDMLVSNLETTKALGKYNEEV